MELSAVGLSIGPRRVCVVFSCIGAVVRSWLGGVHWGVHSVGGSFDGGNSGRDCRRVDARRRRPRSSDPVQTVCEDWLTGRAQELRAEHGVQPRLAAEPGLPVCGSGPGVAVECPHGRTCPIGRVEKSGYSRSTLRTVDLVLAKAFGEQTGRTLGVHKPRESDVPRSVWTLAEARCFLAQVAGDRLVRRQRVVEVPRPARCGRSHPSRTTASVASFWTRSPCTRWPRCGPGRRRRWRRGTWSPAVVVGHCGQTRSVADSTDSPWRPGFGRSARIRSGICSPAACSTPATASPRWPNASDTTRPR